jgi:hypothetical protein
MATKLRALDGESIEFYSDNNADMASLYLSGSSIKFKNSSSVDMFSVSTSASGGVAILNGDLTLNSGASIKGAIVNLGVSGNVINLNVAGVTYNFGTLAGNVTFSGTITANSDVGVSGVITSRIKIPVAQTTWYNHTVANYKDAAIISRANTEDGWIFCDGETGQWGIYHRQIDSDLVVSGQKTLPANSVGFVGSNVLTAYLAMSSGNFWSKGSISADGNLWVTGTCGITSTSTFTGLGTFNGGITITGTTTLSSLTATTVPYLNASKQMTSSAVTPTELGYLSGVSSAIQTQINVKSVMASTDNSIYSKDTRATQELPSDRSAGLYVDFKNNTTDGLSDGGVYHGVLLFRTYGGTTDFGGGPAKALGFSDNGNLWIRQSADASTWGTWKKIWGENNATGAVTTVMSSNLTVSRALVSDTNGKMAVSSVTAVELGYLSGVTSVIQTQINGKEPTVTKGNLTELTSAILTIGGGTGAVIGSGATITVKKASGTQNGYLDKDDWTTFNSKQPAGSYEPALTKGLLTSASPIVLSDSTRQVIGGACSISIPAATSLVDGYLAKGDWSTFNGKQNALGYTPVNKAGDTMSSTLTITQNVNSPGLILSGASTGWASGIQFVNNTATTGRGYGIYSNNTGSFIISDETAGASRITMNSTGSIGIGMVPNTSKLAVGGDVYANGNIDISGVDGRRIYMGGVTGGSYGIAYNSSSPNYGIFYKEGTIDKVTLAPNGGGPDGTEFVVYGTNVGIGLNTPGYPLHIKKAGTGAVELIALQSDEGTSTIRIYSGVAISIAGDGAYFYNDGSVILGSGDGSKTVSMRGTATLTKEMQISGTGLSYTMGKMSIGKNTIGAYIFDVNGAANVSGNLDVGAGVDVTGNLTVTGTTTMTGNATVGGNNVLHEGIVKFARISFVAGKSVAVWTHNLNWSEYIVQITPNSPETHFYYKDKGVNAVTICLDDEAYEDLVVDVVLTKTSNVVTSGFAIS